MAKLVAGKEVCMADVFCLKKRTRADIRQRLMRIGGVHITGIPMLVDAAAPATRLACSGHEPGWYQSGLYWLLITHESEWWFLGWASMGDLPKVEDHQREVFSIIDELKIAPMRPVVLDNEEQALLECDPADGYLYGQRLDDPDWGMTYEEDSL